MEDRHIQQLIQNLIDRFEHFGESNFDLDKEFRDLSHPITREPIQDDNKLAIEKEFLTHVRYKRSHDGAVLVPVSIVSDPRDHEEWYDEWLENNDDALGSYYWKRLENFLSKELTRKYGAESAGEVVQSIDGATHSIMKMLSNPRRKEFNFKGLVVGFVQSGKTANFTALIAKAADSGYKFIVVLSGIHSILRRQTQIRLDKELTGMNDMNLDDSFIDEPSDIKRWNRITTGRLRKRTSRNGQIIINDLGEFDTINVDPFDSLCNRSTPTIAIIKKNVKVLERLIAYISQSNNENRSRMPLLIIDDEADQASVNGNANDPDSDPTTTNQRIRDLLGLFSRKTYVGYTATPFANVLINMTDTDDLYPNNFIVSLPRPSGYFGASSIFKGDLSNRFVQQIPDEGNELIRYGTITANLANAVDQFLFGCAVRNLRNDRMKPMSMLVHISQRINTHGVLAEIITGYISDLTGRYGNKSSNTQLKTELQEEWELFTNDCDTINSELDCNNPIPEFNFIWEELGNVLSAIQVIELNSSSDDILDYTTNEEIKVIAIGGNQLSRGLTLEGLMVSYYLRASRQYDTLLQMARWFGYRHGYQDLTRVHTTEVIWEFFEHLALVEEELRSEIYRYEEDKLTPMKMAVAIRDHRTLSVTSPNKIGAGRRRQTSFSKSLNQTIWFPLDKPEALRANLMLGKVFIQDINNDCGFNNVDDTGVYLAKGKIDGERVLESFLNRYTFASKESTGGPGLDAEGLLSYIFRRLNDSELTEWSVAVVGNATPQPNNTPTNFGGLRINTIQRSRKHTSKGYNIGVLTDPEHLRIDLEENATSPYDGRSPQNPLLLLYPIWKNSEARMFKENPNFDERIDLFRFIETEKVDVLAIGIVLPSSNYEPDNYIGQ
ncbi:Z1 domain-containing protein [Mangrovibacterium lignilyticum]|uniref:Z1 domain-containing protein n=1 Tax=Mangrovibacterium lignilyticum TaxID=2668052 RepID=UPI0013D0E8CF|nr:Z1 domain-containing protein [Mangrovibacterium lignilyticum]